MGERGKHVAMREGGPPPRVTVIETSYVTITDPSRFKSVVQSLTGATPEKKVVGKKRLYKEETGFNIADVVTGNKRQSCDGNGCSELLKVDSFKEELQRIFGAPELAPMEDKNYLEWLFNNNDDE